MTKILAVVFAAITGLTPLVTSADLVRLNLGETWRKPQNVVWIGKLVRIDPEEDLATFAYVYDQDDFEFSVHITRIVWIEFNAQIEMSDNFPRETSRDFAAPLEANPGNDPRRSILLENRGGEAADVLPPDVRAVPRNLAGPDIRVFGIIISVDDQEAILILTKRDGRRTSLVVDRQLLKNWVREP